MGFGLIFIGYVTLLILKIMPPAMAIGSFVMYRGFKKLEKYDKYFALASYLSIALTVYYAVYTLFWLRFPFDVFNTTAFTLTDDIVYYALLLAFHICLYKALENISRYCGYDKGVKRAYMSRVLMAMTYVLTAANIPLRIMAINSYLPLAALICYFAWIMYTGIFIYGCYMRIATDEIIEEEEKKLREYDEKYSFRTKKKK